MCEYTQVHMGKQILLTRYTTLQLYVQPAPSGWSTMNMDVN